jgi:hypothetical protein
MNDLKTSLRDLIDDTRLPTPPSMDELRERTGRRRYQPYQPRRLFLGTLTAVVVVSGVTLAVVYGPRSAPTVPRSTDRHHAHANVPASNPGNQTEYRQAFRRTVEGGTVVIRAFHESGQTAISPRNDVGPVPTAYPPNSLEADITSPTGVVARNSAFPPTNVGPGQAEVFKAYSFGDPGEVVDVAVIFSGSKVRSTELVSQAGVSDQMTPIGGWSILAVLNSPGNVQLTGTTSTGGKIDDQAVSFSPTSGVPLDSPPLFVRTTSDGLLIRGGEYQGFVTMAVSNTWAGTNFEGIRECAMTTPDSLYATPSSLAGVREGSPFSAIPVLVGPGVAEVKVTWADGSSDQMAPIGGIAILGHQGTSPPTKAIAMDSSGSTVAVQNLQTAPPGGSNPPCLR